MTTELSAGSTPELPSAGPAGGNGGAPVACREVLRALADFDRDVMSLDQRRIVGGAIAFLTERLAVPHSSVALLRQERGVFQVLDISPDIGELGKDSFIPLENTVLSEIVRDGRPRYRPDIAGERSGYPVDETVLRAGYRSDFLLPLACEGECLGTLNCASSAVDGFPVELRELLALLAPRLAQTLTHARLYDEVERQGINLAEAQRIARMGSWEWDLEQDRLFWSRGLYRVFGVDPEHFEPRSEAILHFVHPDDIAGVRQAVETLYLHGEPCRVVHRIIRGDGSIRWLHGEAELIRDAQGQPLTITGFLQDVTERKRAEEERLRLESKVQETQRLESLGVMAGGIAHDFNNLLMGVLGNADLALQALDSEAPARRYLTNIATAAERTAELAQQLLAYSGRCRFDPQAIDLTGIVEEMSHLVKASLSKKATIRYELADDLPAVEGDPTQLRQIVLNLVTNASDALEGPTGRIDVATGVADVGADELSTAYFGEDLTPGRYCCLEVTDTGCGMDRETVSRVFDPFFSTKPTGRGLGLATVQSIIRRHRGAIRIDSEPGRGTRIRVFLPISQRPLPDPVPADEAPGDWSAQGLVLVVDDEPEVRQIAGEMLESLGFDVLSAEDGRQGVELFRRHADEVVLVLLDLTMPRLSGGETFRRIREIRPDVGVLLSSGFDQEDTLGKLAGQGPAGFVQKPYKLATLRNKLRRALGRPSTSIS